MARLGGPPGLDPQGPRLVADRRDGDEASPATKAATFGEYATDGGQHIEDAPDATVTSLSTVYRLLQRIDGGLESGNGHVQSVSEAPRKEVRGIAQSVEHAIEPAADRAAELVSTDLPQSASSAFDEWTAKHGADLDWSSHDGDQVRVRLDTLLSAMNDDRLSPEQAIAEM